MTESVFNILYNQFLQIICILHYGLENICLMYCSRNVLWSFEKMFQVCSNAASIRLSLGLSLRYVIFINGDILEIGHCDLGQKEFSLKRSI